MLTFLYADATSQLSPYLCYDASEDIFVASDNVRPKMATGVFV